MQISILRKNAYRVIVENDELFKTWINAKTEDERMNIMLEVVYDMGKEDALNVETSEV